MSTRLQVVVDDADLERFQAAAEREGVTLSEWVRRALRGAERVTPKGDPRHKLAAIRAAARLAFPVGDVDEMLAEIERGYQQDL